ncbi:CPBP family intramembrane glutamic endopeptidase [Pengzhenrongella phosphoraccumulans]|uniref:CPBP family intramembrane glutamic endopeptidase n=1 Tax=Pengzhenrongella phosphoraccumulans TaxID=3114394 RepID=UPI00388E069C
MGIVWKLAGTDYETVGLTADNAFAGIFLAVGAAALFIALTTSYLGWWSPALREAPSGPRWLLILPILIFVSALGTLLSKGFTGIEAKLALTLALGTLFVGFGEEMTTRGVGVVALRGGMGEVGVWFVSSLLFGLLHSMNVLFGQSVTATVGQIGFAFVMGSVLYLIRRVTGALVVCMLLHAFWDFSTFMAGASTGDANPLALLAFFQYLAVLIAVVGLVMVLRKGRVTAGSRTAVAN